MTARIGDLTGDRGILGGKGCHLIVLVLVSSSIPATRSDGMLEWRMGVRRVP
jgi:hypothetical protein